MATERDVSVRVRLKGANEFKTGMQGINSSLSGLSGWLDVTKGILGSQIITRGLQKIAQTVKECFNASMDFESAMAGVAKTTDMSDIQLENMANQLMALSERIPMSATELAGLAESAGQLGIAQEDILEFTEVMAALGVSTNLSAEDAATALAQLANIMGTSASEYERMGSAIVALGNSSATTEADIVEMAQNMAGAAKLVGMSEADVFGFSAALSSIGIEAQAGGSSMQKLFLMLDRMTAVGNEGLEEFARVAGMSMESFVEAWGEDPARAVQAIIEGLGRMEESGQSASAWLNEMELNEIRLTRSMLGLATSGDLLAKSLDTGNQAWKENSALATEAGIRYKTTESRIEMAQNAVENLKIAAGDSMKSVVVTGSEAFASWASSIRESITELDSLPDYYAKVDEALEAEQRGIEMTAVQARALTDRLDELGSASEMTTADQMEYMAILETLTQVMPGLAGAIDLETGAIQGGTDALRENIDATAALSRQSAELDALREKYDAYKIAQENVANQSALLVIAETELTEAQAEQNRILEEQTSAQERINELNAELAELDTQLNPDTGRYAEIKDEISELQQAVNGYTEALPDAAQAAYDAQIEVDNLNGKIKTNTQYLDENAGVVGEYEAALNGMGQTLDDVTGASVVLTDTQQTAVNRLEALAGVLEEAQTEYDEVYATVKKTVDGIITGYGKIEYPEPESPTEMIEGLESQLAYMEQYRQNLQTAQEMGYDDTYLATLADGSEESAAILAGLVNSSVEEVETLNAKYAEVETAKAQFAADLATVQTDVGTTTEYVTTAVNTMVDECNQNAEAYSSAASTIQGLIDGIDAKITTLSGRSARVSRLLSFGSGNTGNPTHVRGAYASGLTYVPEDGFIAQLHRGEMVLTALEAKAYRAEQFANYGMLAALQRAGGSGNVDNRRSYTTDNRTSVQFGDVYVRGDADTKEIARNIAELNRRRARGRGKILA